MYWYYKELVVDIKVDNRVDIRWAMSVWVDRKIPQSLESSYRETPKF